MMLMCAFYACKKGAVRLHVDIDIQSLDRHSRDCYYLHLER
jgi:hypothetical protein